ncbi:MAG: hypothetical protein ACI9MR_004242 [Myxococcota bacterium]|jgi:uncharacterized protein YabN with tetrapyrrole methylase and pyrophosphatase domain
MSEALTRARRVGSEAALVGFKWDTIAGPLAKVDEELAELREAIDGDDVAALRHELGDLLFAVVNVARHLEIPPAVALNAATDRFEARYGHVAAALEARGVRFEDTVETELNRLWAAAKRAVG